MRCRVFRSVRFFPSTLCRRGSSIDFNYRGNWSVDLQAGSDFGYKLLFVILLSGFFAVVVQVYFLPFHIAKQFSSRLLKESGM